MNRSVQRMRRHENGATKEAGSSFFVKNAAGLKLLALAICLPLALSEASAASQSAPAKGSVQTYYHQAEQDIRAGNLDKARVAASRALQLSPRMAAAANLLGLIEEISGHPAEAEGYFKRAVKSNPNYGPAHLNLAQLYLKQNKSGPAKQELETAVRIDPANGGAQYLLGAALQKDGDPAGAIVHLKAALRTDPANYLGLMSLLTCQLALGQMADAKQSSDQINQVLAPRDPRRMQLGILLADHAAYALAIPVYRRVLEADSGSYDAGYNLALALFLTDDTQEAKAVLKQVLPQHDTAELHDLLGEVCEKREEYQEAVPEFEKASSMDPANEDYRFDYGLALIEYKAFHQAVDVLTQATKDFPNSGRLWSALGGAEFVWGQYERAAQDSAHAADLAPDLSISYYCLGRVYSKVSAESQKLIMAKLKSYLALNPSDPWAHCFYGIGLFQEQERGGKDFTSAEAHLRKAIELESDIAEAHFRLGLVLTAQNKAAEGVAEFIEACRLDPGLREAHYRLGLAYAKMGEKAKAEKELKLQQQLQADTEEERRKQFFQALPHAKTAAATGKP